MTTRGSLQETSQTPTPDSQADALATVDGGEAVALPSPRGIARTVVAVLAQPRPLAREAVRLGRDMGRNLRGTDEIAPSPKDKRFADPAWTENAAYRRLAQEYVALGAALTRLVDGFEAGGADWREVEQARQHTGSWWEPWAAWMLERSGDEVPAPTGPGSARHPVLEPAPGSYVLDRAPA